MLNIVLVEPEIPQNTGNIARTCAATRSRLHLVRPLGFDISERAVRRAGLDYWHLVDLQVYDSLDHFFAARPVAGHHQGSPGLYPGAVPARLLAHVRQGDRRPAGGPADKLVRPVHPDSHAGGRPEPESGQLGGRAHL